MKRFTMKTGTSSAAMTRILSVTLLLSGRPISVATVRAAKVEGAGARHSIAVENACAWQSPELMATLELVMKK